MRKSSNRLSQYTDLIYDIELDVYGYMRRNKVTMVNNLPLTFMDECVYVDGTKLKDLPIQNMIDILSNIEDELNID